MQYDNAPITEALVDIRVQLPETVGLPELGRLREALAPDYPTCRDRMQVTGKIMAGAHVDTMTSRSHIGYVLLDRGERQLVQLRLGGFTFNLLAPYTDWVRFTGEAHRLWVLYRETVHPVRVERIGVRYINRFNLPLPMGDLRDYFRTLPELSPALPQMLAGFIMQLQVPMHDIHGTLIINQVGLPSDDPEIAPVLLDLELSRSDAVPQDDAGIWDYLDRLRERKNQVFEACITDRARELMS